MPSRFFSWTKGVSDRLNYSHPFNRKKFRERIEGFQGYYRERFELVQKASSEFRSAHLQVVAAVVVLVAFFGERVEKDPRLADAAWWFMLFILISIPAVFFGYSFSIYQWHSQHAYVHKHLLRLNAAIQDIDALRLTREKSESINDELRSFKIPSPVLVPILLGLLVASSWFCCFLGAYRTFRYFSEYGS